MLFCLLWIRKFWCGTKVPQCRPNVHLYWENYVFGEKIFHLWATDHVEGAGVSIGRQKVFCLGAALWQEVGKKQELWQEVDEEEKKLRLFCHKTAAQPPLFLLSINTRQENMTITIGTSGRVVLYPTIIDASKTLPRVYCPGWVYNS